jgi:hypothetical protein
MRSFFPSNRFGALERGVRAALVTGLSALVGCATADSIDTEGGGPPSGGAIELCVLVNPQPDASCRNPAELDFGEVQGGTAETRLFRLDNETGEDVVFEAADSGAAEVVVVAVRFEEDPGSPGSFVRVEEDLPRSRAAGESLWFEVTVVGGGASGAVPADSVVVKHTVGGEPSPDTVVPIVGSVTACPANKGACDGDPDNGCETNLLTDPDHCGACGEDCNTPFGTGACVEGECAVANCNTNFGDCDGEADNGCETNLVGNAMHCGGCGNACAQPNTAATCQGTSCVVTTCLNGFEDCNLDALDGCEADLDEGPSTCGSCDNDCAVTLPGSEAACVGGSCQFLGCLPGFYDLDGSAQNGCEYACNFVSATDLPDDAFADDNCDGIDGDVADAIFVATTGSDSNQGSINDPVASVTVGLTRAQAQGKSRVLVSSGTYTARVVMVSGISIHGGYSAQAGWSRSELFVSEVRSGTILGGRVTALDGTNILAATTIDRLTIRTLDTAVAGTNNYAVYCNNCDALTLRHNVIVAGNAGPGAAGSAGTAGAVGGNGGLGAETTCDGNGSGGTGGTAGSSSCGRTGGAGGKGGASGQNNGSAGGTGVSGVSGGSGGSWGDPGGDGANGTNGSAGANGSSGSGGSGGSVVSNFWASNAGGNGTNGVHGNGGGGGGGGGAQSCFFCDDGQGNGGGGGGGGGCLGTGGTGGSGGGGSFGVFLVASGATVLLEQNTIESGNGGAGGAGGTGGVGGNGGTGGLGGNNCTSEIGEGGDGGNGGKGGNGGAGGGGAGGPTYGIYRVTTTGVLNGNTITVGTPGAGGSGGNAGTAGASAMLF